jgi:hypothetical protein
MLIKKLAYAGARIRKIQNLIILLNFNFSPSCLAPKGRGALVEFNIEKGNNLNYNLLLEKIKDLLSKPLTRLPCFSREEALEVYPDGNIFIKSEQKF